MEEKNLENEKALYSNKINLGKKIHIPWLLILLVFIVATVLSIFKYTEYKKGQEYAIGFTLTSFEAIGKEDRFSQYENDNKTLVQEMYNFYNPNYFSTVINGVTISNSDSIETAEEADLALGRMMKTVGYDCYRGSRYLKHTNMLNFTFAENELAKILYIITASLLIIQLAFLLWYSINQKSSLIIDDGRIICKFGKKAIKEFMLTDISVVDTVFLKGLKIRGNNIKYRIDFLSNSEELKNYIMNCISDYKSENSLVVKNNTSSNADELKKYKDLLDNGIITQEEFDQKKKQLLGL